MAQGGDVKLGQLSKYIFTAPTWKRSLIILILLGLVIDGANARAWLSLPSSGIIAFPLPPFLSDALSIPANFLFSGTIAFTIPAIAALVLTKPLIEYTGKTMTWNRSALLALACTVFGVIITTVACQQGFQATEGAMGVGMATRRTVIISFLTILALGYMITRAFYA